MFNFGCQFHHILKFEAHFAQSAKNSFMGKNCEFVKAKDLYNSRFCVPSEGLHFKYAYFLCEQANPLTTIGGCSQFHVGPVLYETFFREILMEPLQGYYFENRMQTKYKIGEQLKPNTYQFQLGGNVSF